MATAITPIKRSRDRSVTPSNTFKRFLRSSVKTLELNDNKLVGSRTTEYNVNNNKLFASYVKIYLQPLLVTSSKTNNDNINSINDDITTDFQTMYNYSSNKLNMFLMNNNDDDKLFGYAVMIFYITQNIINSSNLNTKIKNCILITSLLSILYDKTFNFNFNIDDFINGTKDEINIIKEMLNLIYNNSEYDSDWKIIPKNTIIMIKTNKMGIKNFINYLKVNNCMNLNSEIVVFCDIIFKYIANNNNCKIDVNSINYLYQIGKLDKKLDFNDFDYFVN